MQSDKESASIIYFGILNFPCVMKNKMHQSGLEIYAHLALLNMLSFS